MRGGSAEVGAGVAVEEDVDGGEGGPVRVPALLHTVGRVRHELLKTDTTPRLRSIPFEARIF